MTWETSKHKLNKINENSINNNRDNKRQKDNDLNIDSRVIKLNRTQGVSSKLYNISKDWVQLEAVEGVFDPETNTWVSESDDWDVQGITNDVDLGIFDIRLLPYIKVNFIFKPLEERDDKRILEWVCQGVFYTVEDVIDDENFQHVILHLSCKIEDFRPLGDQGEYNLTRPWKVKIMITLTNPRLFI